MFDYYIDAFRHYADFEVRASRKAFWYFALWDIIIGFVLLLIHRDLVNLYSLVVLIPGFAITVRRLHDIGKSGWWILLGFIPVIGWIWLIILLAQEGIHKEHPHSSHHKESHHNTEKSHEGHKEKKEE